MRRMKLYISPGACSLSPHIVAHEAGLKLEVETVDLRSHTTASGVDYRTINPKGSVPALKLDDGQVLTEGAVIVQYLADKAPNAKLIAPCGSMERYREQELLNYIAAEIHKSFSPLFNPSITPDAKTAQVDMLKKRFAYVAGKLEGRDYLMGETFTVADAYLFTLSTWTPGFGIDIAAWPALKAHFDRVSARPAVKATLDAEAKLKASASAKS